MNDMMELLYDLVREYTPATFYSDPEYRRLCQKTECLWNEIETDLGPDGRTRLEALMDAQVEEDRFWRLSLFRRTLALGIELGRLQVS